MDLDSFIEVWQTKNAIIMRLWKMWHKNHTKCAQNRQILKNAQRYVIAKIQMITKLSKIDTLATSITFCAFKRFYCGLSNAFVFCAFCNACVLFALFSSVKKSKSKQLSSLKYTLPKGILYMRFWGRKILQRHCHSPPPRHRYFLPHSRYQSHPIPLA